MEPRPFTRKEMIGKTSTLDGHKIMKFVRWGYDSWGRGTYNVFLVEKDGKQYETTVLHKDQIPRWFK